MGVAAVLALFLGIWAPFAKPPAPDTADLASAQPIGESVKPGLELVALRWVVPATTASDAELTLYWRTDAPLTQDLRTVLRLNDASSNQIWEWKRSPASGRYSTDHWQAGELIGDTYRIPLDKLARMKQATLGVYAFPSEKLLSWRSGEWLTLPPAHP
jgi:hypothetical protein